MLVNSQSSGLWKKHGRALSGSRFAPFGSQARHQALGALVREANLRILVSYKNANPPPPNFSLLSSARQLPQKFLFVHAVFEGFAPVDKYNWDFVIKLPPQLAVAIYIHFLPREPAASRELGKTLLHYLTEMASPARVDHDLARFWHAAIFTLFPHPLTRENRSHFSRAKITIPLQE
jgi:hypothetical protein